MRGLLVGLLSFVAIAALSPIAVLYSAFMLIENLLWEFPKGVVDAVWRHLGQKEGA